MNKNTWIILLVVVLLGVGVGGGFYLYSQKHVQKQTAQPMQDDQDVVPTLAPEDIGLKLSQSDSGKFAGHGLVMQISKLDGISTIDCEFSYTANTGNGDLPRGGICKSVQVKSSDTEIKQEYPYGTCSDVCHFDSDISNVKMIVKVTKTDGKTYQVNASL
jgi:uncharacterized protein YneF (UPF0154 family)